MNNFMICFAITFVAGMSTLLGGFIPFFKVESGKKVISVSLAFSAGIMIAISIFDLIPNSFNYLYDNYCFSSIIYVFLFFFLGIILFYILDKLSIKSVDNLYRVGIFSMIAIIFHNIPEGIITFFLSNENVKLGLLMGISVALHNIPEGISIMVPIYYGTGDFKKSFLYTLLAGCSEIGGGIIFYFLFRNYINSFVLGSLFSFVAGIMIYLACFELLPNSFRYGNKNFSLSFFLLGIIFFLLVSILLH